jgi:hypothetical protein
MRQLLSLTSYRLGTTLKSERKNLIGATLLAASLFATVQATRSPAGTDPSPSADADLAATEVSTAAIDRFWVVYRRNHYNSIPEVQRELETALQRDPNNPTLYALLGATHFWHIGEAGRDPNPHDPALQQDMPAAAGLFQSALNLDYYTLHPLGYINDDHLPGYFGITTVHTGQLAGNPTIIARGNAILDFAAYQFPEFNNFNRWAA